MDSGNMTFSFHAEEEEGVKPEVEEEPWRKSERWTLWSPASTKLESEIEEEEDENEEGEKKASGEEEDGGRTGGVGVHDTWPLSFSRRSANAVK